MYIMYIEFHIWNTNDFMFIITNNEIINQWIATLLDHLTVNRSTS